MGAKLELDVISTSFSNLSRATGIPVKVFSPDIDKYNKYRKEFEMEPVLDGPLPAFCRSHHCTNRGPHCDRCAYTAMGSSMRRILDTGNLEDGK